MEAVEIASPMTVVHLEAGCHLYGGALQVKYLLEGLQKFPVRNVLVCPKGAKLATACRSAFGNEVSIIECEMKGDLDWRLSSRIQRILHRENAQLLHIHSRRGADIWGARGANKAQVPVILTRRVDSSEPKWFAHWKYRHLYDSVVAISDGVREVLLNDGLSSQQVKTIHSVVDTEHFQPKPDRRWFEQSFGYSPKDQVIAIVAQLIERKGHKVLFDALIPLFQLYPDLQLMVLGKGPLRKDLENYVLKKGLGERVRFFGFREDIHRVLPNLYLVAHPAHAEGMGVALLQAAACGVPVVASKVGGIPEATLDGEHGVLMQPGDSEQLCVAIKTLIDSPSLRESFSQRARERMVKEFSIASMSQEYFNLYQSLSSKPTTKYGEHR